MWKDPTRGLREISLEPLADAVLLTACADRTSRRTIDGRAPVATVSHLYDVSVNQVRAATTGGGPLPHRPATQTAAVVDTVNLSVLTSWTQAMAEAVASAPEHAAAVLASAQAGASWRAIAGAPDPSLALATALQAVQLAFLAVTHARADTLEELVSALEANEPVDPQARLPFRALRYACESRRSRELRRDASTA